MRTIKCLAVGDGMVGKACLLLSYVNNKFPRGSIPAAIFDNYPVMSMVEKEWYILNLFYTPGQEDYNRLRPLWYPQTDVFLVCFSVMCPASFASVRDRWIPEIRYQCGGRTPFVIVGLQIDRREDQQQQSDRKELKPITTQQGKALAKRLGAAKYVECSALTRVGLSEVFDEAILAVLNRRTCVSRWICRFW